MTCLPLRQLFQILFLFYFQDISETTKLICSSQHGLDNLTSVPTLDPGHLLLLELLLLHVELLFMEQLCLLVPNFLLLLCLQT